LEEKNFKPTFIDSDNIRGELELTEYPEIVKVRKQLEEEGFTWSEEEPGFSLEEGRSQAGI